MGLPNFAGCTRVGVICPKGPSHFKAWYATHCFWKNIELKGNKKLNRKFCELCNILTQYIILNIQIVRYTQ